MNFENNTQHTPGPPDLLKENEQLKEEMELLQKANDGLISNVNLLNFRQRNNPHIEAERLRLSERLNASSKAYGELKALNAELLEALKICLEEYSELYDIIMSSNEKHLDNFVSDEIHSYMKYDKRFRIVIAKAEGKTLDVS